MKIAFDASDLCTARADGTTRYTQELIERFPAMAPDIDWSMHGPCSCPSGVDHRRWIASPFSIGWTQFRFPLELFKEKTDVLFMPIQQLPLFRPRKTKTVAVIHDLAFHEFPQQFRYKDWLLLHTFSAQVAHEADAIIAVSQATKDDIKKYYAREHSVHVIHHGVDHNRFRVFSASEKQDGMRPLQDAYPLLKQPYLLFVGQIQPRKNIVRLVEAFEELNIPGLQLVIAGGHGWNNGGIYERIESSPKRNDIIMPGAVPNTLLPLLYANAEVFVLPSLQEGFGIPLLEAAACGIPLVTSDRSSMKEIVGDAGILINPEDVSSIAQGIQAALQQKEVLSSQSVTLAQKFSWDATARQTLRVLKEVKNI